jgi:hypothetical protein
MKRLRRLAVILAVLSLGVMAWLAVVVSWETKGELRLTRELSTGRLIARIPEPTNVRFIVYGRAELTSSYTQPGQGRAGLLPKGTVFERHPSNSKEKVWYVGLDPLDKTWELEVKESRPMFLKAGGKSWRIGTKTRIWRTNRVPERTGGSSELNDKQNSGRRRDPD